MLNEKLNEINEKLQKLNKEYYIKRHEIANEYNNLFPIGTKLIIDGNHIVVKSNFSYDRNNIIIFRGQYPEGSMFEMTFPLDLSKVQVV